ncbi:putative nuclease HARBI1 [Heterodontus francisci]|uniref:putative nuclease HARBI1 n=1 Tax=Heterodontus francisci TaxID=7792 RepID=UPI00355C008F
MPQSGTGGHERVPAAGQVAPCYVGGRAGDRVGRERAHVRRHAYPTGWVYWPCLSYLHLSERQCRRRLCLSHETVTFLCEILAVDVPSNCLGSHSMPVALKVIVALNFYACGSFQASMADLCGVSQAAPHHCIKVVTDALFRCANNFICFKTDTSQAERSRGLSAIVGFPMVHGVIDCTHVAIRSPAGHSGAFINQKGFHSLNVQLVCDHRKRIRQVCARYPGSYQDAYILRNSQVPALFSPPDRPEGWLLGDRGYLLMTWLMTPMRIPRGLAKEHFNVSHVATRVTIEQIIGLLKMRFRCLDCSGGSLQYTPARVSRIIVVCCALHNFAMEKGDAIEEVQGNREASSDEDGDSDEDAGHHPLDGMVKEAECPLELRARETRDALIGRHFSCVDRYMKRYHIVAYSEPLWDSESGRT